METGSHHIVYRCRPGHALCVLGVFSHCCCFIFARKTAARAIRSKRTSLGSSTGMTGFFRAARQDVPAAARPWRGPGAPMPGATNADRPVKGTRLGNFSGAPYLPTSEKSDARFHWPRIVGGTIRHARSHTSWRSQDRAVAGGCRLQYRRGRNQSGGLARRWMRPRCGGHDLRHLGRPFGAGAALSRSRHRSGRSAQDNPGADQFRRLPQGARWKPDLSRPLRCAASSFALVPGHARAREASPCSRKTGSRPITVPACFTPNLTARSRWHERDRRTRT